jgi:hypothetical protein
MARQERDREDLLKEAVAFKHRASLRLAGSEEELFVGFRENGAASFYFDSERAYHFNSSGQLRRAFIGDRLVKAERGNFVALRRERTTNNTSLIRHELTAAEADALLADVRQDLQRLRDALAESQFVVAGLHPADRDVVGMVRDWLTRFAGRLEIAARPHAQ